MVVNPFEESKKYLKEIKKKQEKIPIVSNAEEGLAETIFKLDHDFSQKACSIDYIDEKKNIELHCEHSEVSEDEIRKFLGFFNISPQRFQEKGIILRKYNHIKIKSKNFSFDSSSLPYKIIWAHSKDGKEKNTAGADGAHGNIYLLGETGRLESLLAFVMLFHEIGHMYDNLQKGGAKGILIESIQHIDVLNTKEGLAAAKMSKERSANAYLLKQRQFFKDLDVDLNTLISYLHHEQMNDYLK